MRTTRVRLASGRRWLAVGLCLLVGLAGAAGAQVEEVTPAAPNEIAYLRLTDGYWQVWVTDSEGAAHRQLTSDAMDKSRISWSGAKRALLINRNNGELVSVTLEGDSTPLSLPITGMLDAAWSHDGARIAFSLNATQTTDNNDLWIMNTDGTGARKLTNQPGVVQSPGWHPGDQSLAYSLGVARNYVDLWRIDVDSGSKDQLSVGGSRYFNPAYASNGTLLYTTDIDGNFNIWALDKEGKAAPVTQDAAYDSEPSPSPEGESVAFYSLRGGTKRIWIKNIGSGEIRAITPADEQSRYPVWLY